MQLGKLAYETYRETRGIKVRWSRWDELSQDTRTAWDAVAETIVAAVFAGAATASLEECVRRFIDPDDEEGIKRWAAALHRAMEARGKEAT